MTGSWCKSILVVLNIDADLLCYRHYDVIYCAALQLLSCHHNIPPMNKSLSWVSCNSVCNHFSLHVSNCIMIVSNISSVGIGYDHRLARSMDHHTHHATQFLYQIPCMAQNGPQIVCQGKAVMEIFIQAPIPARMQKSNATQFKHATFWLLLNQKAC